MSSSSVFINNGVEHIKTAVAADNEENYPKALELYLLGIDNILKALKYEKNEQIKKTLIQKANQYTERAEYLKKNMTKLTCKKASANNAGGDNSENEGTAEKSKMEDALSGAIVIEKPNVKWSDVAGLTNAKEMLKEAVILPIKFPQMFTGKRKPWKGILLYGPPGTGKSFLAKAVATEANNSTFFSVSSSDLVSKYFGESEKMIRTLFEMARKQAPSIIFIDEVDSLCGKRSDGENESSRRIKTEFLVQMQGVGKTNDQILVLGATNTPWQLDPAIRRRFERRVYIPLPDAEARKAMFRLMVAGNASELSEEDIEELSQLTEGFSCSDLDSINRDALYEPVRSILQSKFYKKVADNEGKEFYVPCSMGDKDAEEMNVMDLPPEMVRPEPLSVKDYLRVIPNATCSVSQNDLDEYTKWTEEFGIDG